MSVRVFVLNLSMIINIGLNYNIAERVLFSNLIALVISEMKPMLVDIC